MVSFSFPNSLILSRNRLQSHPKFRFLSAFVPIPNLLSCLISLANSASESLDASSSTRVGTATFSARMETKFAFSAVKTQKLRVENESLPFSYFLYCVSKGIITAIYSIVCSFSPRSLQVLPFGSPVSPVSTFGECISLVERMETRPIAFDLLSFLLFPRFHFLKGRNAQTDAAATLPRLNWMAETPLLRFIEAKSIEFSAEPTSFSQNLQKSALFWSTNQFDVPFSLSSL